MLDVMPIGVIVFPGAGIQANVAWKAMQLGIPVWKFDDSASTPERPVSTHLGSRPQHEAVFGNMPMRHSHAAGRVEGVAERD